MNSQRPSHTEQPHYGKDMAWSGLQDTVRRHRGTLKGHWQRLLFHEDCQFEEVRLFDESVSPSVPTPTHRHIHAFTAALCYNMHCSNL